MGDPNVGCPPAPQHSPGCGQRCPRVGPSAVHELGSALLVLCPLSSVHCSPPRRGAGEGGGPCARPFLLGAVWGLPLCCGTAARRPEGSVTPAPIPCCSPLSLAKNLSCARVPAFHTPLVSAVGVSPCRRADLGRAGGRGAALPLRIRVWLCATTAPPPCGKGVMRAGGTQRPPCFPPPLCTPWLVHRSSPAHRNAGAVYNGSGWSLAPRWDPCVLPPPWQRPRPGGNLQRPRGAPAPACPAEPRTGRQGRSRAASAPAGPRTGPACPSPRERPRGVAVP